jgi:hypothetical protein
VQLSIEYLILYVFRAASEILFDFVIGGSFQSDPAYMQMKEEERVAEEEVAGLNAKIADIDQKIASTPNPIQKV